MIGRLVLGALFLTSISAVAVAQIANGDFEGGVTGGDPNDWVCHGNVSVLTVGTKHLAKLDEPNSGGGVSRLFQVITAPPGLGSGRLSFRYALVSFPTAGPASATTPPDTFTVFLVDPNTGARQRLVTTDPPVTNPLFWGRGFLCEDTEGHREFASSAVSVTGPDADWMYTVVFLTDLEPNQQARLEFGLAGAANGRTTFAVVDDVTIGCPPGYCCDNSGNIAVIDDGNPCTVDSCDNGVAQHVSCCDPNEVCGNVRVMFMVDMSPSMSTEMRAQTREALLNVLAAYEPNSANVRIGLGRFGVDPNDPNHPHDPNHAIAEILRSPTSDYNSVRAKLMDPNFFVDSWGTPLADAITKAKIELQEPNQHWTKCIVLLTDGFANCPPGPSGCHPNRCDCNEARAAAIDAAHHAVFGGDPDADDGVIIAAKMYYGVNGQTPSGDRCPRGNRDSNDCWLPGSILSDPNVCYGVEGFMRDMICTQVDGSKIFFPPPDPNGPPPRVSCELADLMRRVVACHSPPEK